MGFLRSGGKGGVGVGWRYICRVGAGVGLEMVCMQGKTEWDERWRAFITGIRCAMALRLVCAWEEVRAGVDKFSMLEEGKIGAQNDFFVLVATPTLL